MGYKVDSLQLELTVTAKQTASSLNKVAKALNDIKKQTKDITALINLRKELSKLSKVQLAPIADALSNIAKSSKSAKEKLAGMGDSVSQVNDLKNAVKETAHGTDDLVATSNKATETLNNTAESVKKLGIGKAILQDIRDKVELSSRSLKTKLVAGVDGVTKAFKRLSKYVGYRTIRAAFIAITKSFTEGLKSAYAWSAVAENGYSKLAETMDGIATTSSQMRRQLGAAFGETMRLIAPFVNGFLNAINAIADEVTQFLAAVSGEKTYMRAKRIDTQWQDIGDSEKEATSALKAYKKELLGIDELNVLGKDDKKGKEVAVEVPETEYELAAIKRNWFTDIAVSIHDILFNWDDVDSDLVGQKICAGLGLATGGIIGFALGGVGGAIIGSITGLVVGAYVGSVLFDMEKAKYAPKTTKSDIEQAIGIGLVGAGVGFTLAGIPGAIVGFGIGALVSVIASKFTDTIEEKAWKEYVNSELGQHIQDFYENHIKKDLKVSAELLAEVDAIDVDFSDNVELKNIKSAKKLIEDIFTLDGIQVKTPEQMQELKAKIEAVNALKLDGIQIEFDDLTGKVKTNREELEKNLKKLEDTARIKAATETYNKLIQKQIDVEYELEIATDDLKTAMKDMAKANGKALTAQDELAEAQEEYRLWCEEHGYPAIQGMTNYTSEEKDELDALQKKISKATVKSEAMSLAVQDASKSVADAKTAVANLTEAHQLATDKAKKMIKIINNETDAIDGIKKSINEATTAIANNITELGKWDSKLGTKRTINVDYAVGVDMNDAAMMAMLKGMGFEKKASGGFVEGGHLFFANENGNPEYIGNMGGTTAVANSDQMSAAIEQAAYAGMARALQQYGNSNSGNNWEPMSSEDMYLMLKKKATSTSRRTGVSVAF